MDTDRNRPPLRPMEPRPGSLLLGLLLSALAFGSGAAQAGSYLKKDCVKCPSCSQTSNSAQSPECGVPQAWSKPLQQSVILSLMSLREAGGAEESAGICFSVAGGFVVPVCL
ncbi:hypothetical protein SRHO_G00188130 [Serrasalmus rhombeus]